MTGCRHRVVRTVIPAIGAAVLFFAGGCISVGPDYEPPEMETPDAWSDAVRAGFLDGVPDLSTWWVALDDPTLSELIALAFVGNRDLRIAVDRIEEARALRGAAAGEWYPTVQGVGSAAATRASESTTPVLPETRDREDSLYGLGAAVAWELDLWGRIRRSVESADASIEADIEAYRDTLVALAADVALNYADVRSLQERIRYAIGNADAQRDTLELTGNRRDAGLAPDLDVSQAELNLARTESQIPVLRILLAQAIHRIGVLTGRYPGEVRGILEPDGKIPAVPESVAVGLPVNAIRQRPDVRRAERLLAAQTARIGVATADLYPTLTLPGSFVLEAIDASDVLDGGSLQYSLGPAFRWNLFTGGRVRSLVGAEEARARQALHAYEQTVLLAVEEVEGSMVALRQESLRELRLEDAVDAAARSVSLSKTLYTNGLTDFQNVLDMERSLAEQQDALAASRGNQVRALVSLYRALGGGWSAAEQPQPSTTDGGE